MLAALLSVAGSFPDCPGADCPGTAWERSDAAVRAARRLDLNLPWPEVRDGLVSACGLRVQRSTNHCFNDFNHVDCCTMVSASTHRTNEESRVPGMHAVNQLGPHITEAALESHGKGGSWCTCQLSSPYDVCHRQFGARTAFKLVWCAGSSLAIVVDDEGNVINRGVPHGDDGALPQYGGERARMDNWGTLMGSTNSTWVERWQAACDHPTHPREKPPAEAGARRKKELEETKREKQKGKWQKDAERATKMKRDADAAAARRRAQEVAQRDEV